MNSEDTFLYYNSVESALICLRLWISHALDETLRIQKIQNLKEQAKHWKKIANPL